MSSYGGDSEYSEYSMDMGWSTEYSPSDSGSNEWPYWTSGGSGSDQSASDPSDGNNSEQEDADPGDEHGNGNGLAPVTPVPSVESIDDLPGLSHENDTETTASLATVENSNGEQGGTVIVVQMPTHGPEWDVSDVEGADSLPAYDEDTPPVYDAHDADSTQPPVQLQIDVQFTAQPSPTLPRTTHGPSCPCAVCVMVYGPQTLNVTPPQPSAAELEAERQARVERWRAAHADSDSEASEADETTPLNETEGHWGYATVAAMSHEENERRQRRQRRRERRRRQQQQGYARASIRRSLEIANRVYAVSGLLGNRRTEYFLALCYLDIFVEGFLQYGVPVLGIFSALLYLCRVRFCNLLIVWVMLGCLEVALLRVRHDSGWTSQEHVAEEVERCVAQVAERRRRRAAANAV